MSLSRLRRGEESWRGERVLHGETGETEQPNQSSLPCIAHDTLETSNLMPSPSREGRHPPTSMGEDFGTDWIGDAVHRLIARRRI